ncbi:MAG: deoxyribose-phosphate aldolase [Flavobacteriaceae bacterium]
MNLNQYIDHTLLKPTATVSDIVKLCTEAKTHSFYAVCVHGCHVPLAKETLKDSKVKLAAVIGFPLGAMSTESKLFETKYCIEQGADEIDMVINLGWFKSGLLDLVKQEIVQIKEVLGPRVLKVIIETCYLTEEEKLNICKLILETEADFVKTSTGFGSGGATFEDVQLIAKIIKQKKKIKVSGGIKDKNTAMQYIEMGASRIGTSSGINIIKD